MCCINRSKIYTLKMLKQTCFFSFVLFMMLLSNVKANWILTSAVREEYIDGPDGKCQYDNGGFSVCETWKNLGETDSAMTRLRNPSTCRYFVKFSRFACIKNVQGAERKTCFRKRFSYYMRSSCYNHSLNWEACDAVCGGGLSRRYLFTELTKYSYETRKCNVHDCPKWDIWKPSMKPCDESCLKPWNRECLYEEKVVSSNRCPKDFAYMPGNGTVLLLPCSGNGCNNVLPATTTSTSSSTTLKPTTKLVVSSPIIDLEKDVVKSDCDTEDTSTDILDNVTHIFARTTFWIGFFLGLALLLIVFFLFCICCSLTRRGKAMVRVWKLPRKTLRLLFINPQQQTNNNNKTNIAVRNHSSLSELAQFKLQAPKPNCNTFYSSAETREASMCSYPSIRKTDCSPYLTSGSVSGGSRSQESPKKNSNSEYETYFTPVGKAKLQSQNRRPLPQDPFYMDVPVFSPNQSESDELSSDCDEWIHGKNDEKHRKVSCTSLQRHKSSTLHDRHCGSSGIKEQNAFVKHGEDDVYIRKYTSNRDCRKARRVQSAKHHKQRKRDEFSPKATPLPSYFRRKPFDHQANNPNVNREKPNYTQPYKPKSNQTPDGGRRNLKKLRSFSNDEDNEEMDHRKSSYESLTISDQLKSASGYSTGHSPTKEGANIKEEDDGSEEKLYIRALPHNLHCSDLSCTDDEFDFPPPPPIDQSK